MKFILDLLKLLLVILPLIGKMLHTNYKRKHIDEKDVTEEDNELFEQEEKSNNLANNDSIANNRDISNSEI